MKNFNDGSKKFLGFRFWTLLFKLWLQLLQHWELARAPMRCYNVECWMLNVELWDKVNICRVTTLNIWFCIARLADAIRTIVWNCCDATIRHVGFMTSATTSTSERMERWRSTVSCWRWGLMPDLIIDVLSASAMREVWMSKASLATPWRLSRKRDSWIFSGIWRFSFRKRKSWGTGTCLGQLPKSARVWMLKAGLLDTALINSYNSFWLALLAKRSFFLTVKERYLRKLSNLVSGIAYGALLPGSESIL